MGLTGIERYLFGKRQAVGIHSQIAKEINAENIESPAYAYAVAA